MAAASAVAMRPELSPLRVLVVYPHALVRAGLSVVVNREPGMAVVAEAASGVEAIRCYRDQDPDVVRVDLLLTDKSGETLVGRLLAEFPRARIVALTAARGCVQMLRVLNARVKDFSRRPCPAPGARRPQDHPRRGGRGARRTPGRPSAYSARDSGSAPGGRRKPQRGVFEL